ncbi:probable protein phosphatase 2C 45 isoform X4 [Panicum virgatum]|uniref:protein-serine/threonine phosphatase n=1 Tax=Panicum virgatum TaxID=38727 RepID=A0A8T0QQL0_PANVG|nr:probable protein phosphatase 2C 45 isoform X4 [Panicum virgatum]KAG2575364.1 hypothetical protein PVAP13_7KG429900 [Panicum virgatum]
MGYLSTVIGHPTDGSPVSGGGLSQNGKFSYGYASSPGKRASMEDFYETKIDCVDDQIVGLFGVFDGHGGAKVAEYVKENLFSHLLRHPKFMSDTKVAIAVAVSKDHKPDQTDERQRIEDAGGFVMWAGTWRVGGVLAVSRAFGDKLLKQYVVVDPEIREEVVDDTLEFLILASDGLWDVVSNEEAVALTRSIQDPEEAAKKLLQEAYKRESSDNITCVVVRFLHGQGSSGYA